MITLRDHQRTALSKAVASWHAGSKNVCVVLPTGAGKTLVIAQQAKDNAAAGIITVVFAHRDVLLGQISSAMCMLGVHHRFMASRRTVGEITTENMLEHGDSFYSERSNVIVASVDTFYLRVKKGLLDHLLPQVGCWIMDETHHILTDNKWGQCVEAMHNAFGLGVTATPYRSDGKGLGRHADGVFDDLFVGADMGTLIQRGYLSPYKIFVPPTLIDVSGVKITKSGDYNTDQLAAATDKSNITGDAVEHYIKLANGKQAITFCVNIEHAKHVAEAFNAAGVKSCALSSKTPAGERAQAVRDFKAGLIKNLVNCDLFGEGFDVPAVEVVIMLRKTESYSLFKQQFGRGLRVIDGKEYGILIDHVGNVIQHCKFGAPHDDPEWSLDRVTKRKSNDDGSSPTGVVCPECMAYYVPTNRTRPTCPYCGHTETEVERNQRQQDFQANSGVLVEMEIEFVNRILAERQRIDQPVEVFARSLVNLPSIARHGAMNKHVKRQFAQNRLRAEIQQWCHRTASINGWSIKTVQAEFERVFKINILKAQTLGERQANELLDTIRGLSAVA